MKNLIRFYYGIYIKDFKKNDDAFSFKSNGKQYIFIPFYGDVKTLSDIYTILKKNNKYCHEIVLNKDNSILTFYNNKPHILLKEGFEINKYVDIDEIFNYDIRVYGSYELKWKQLWEKKIDYYEYQMSQLSSKYYKLKNSFNYYVGLTENAIWLLNYIDKSMVNYSISHRRISYKESLNTFFNPVEIIIDSRVRDVSEFLKISYINGDQEINQIFKILDLINFNNTEIILLLSRLIYPSYYFDLYDKIIQDKVSEDKIEFYTNKNADYEAFLKKIYKYLKLKFKIPDIEWLNN